MGEGGSEVGEEGSEFALPLPFSGELSRRIFPGGVLDEIEVVKHEALRGHTSPPRITHLLLGVISRVTSWVCLANGDWRRRPGEFASTNERPGLEPYSAAAALTRSSIRRRGEGVANGDHLVNPAWEGHITITALMLKNSVPENAHTCRRGC